MADKAPDKEFLSNDELRVEAKRIARKLVDAIDHEPRGPVTLALAAVLAYVAETDGTWRRHELEKLVGDSFDARLVMDLVPSLSDPEA